MKKILAIVQNDQVERTIRKALSGHPYTLIVERSGFQAILTAKKEQPDIFISEFELSDMDGRDILTEMGSYGLLTFSPFIFLIEDDWDKKSSTVMDLEMDVIIKQSIVEKELVSVIDQAYTDKLNHIDELNQVQHEFNENFINSGKELATSPQEMRMRLLVIQKLFPLIRLGRMSLDTGIEILDDSNEDIDDKIMDANKFINIGKCITGSQSATPKAVKNIWLIDDDPVQNLLNRIVLKQSNPEWSISEFNDASRAFHELSIRKPDLVFLDINMPGMSGFEFLKKLTANRIDLNVIMLSSSVSANEIKRSFGFKQVVNYLSKPMAGDKVRSMLNAVIDR